MFSFLTIASVAAANTSPSIIFLITVRLSRSTNERPLQRSSPLSFSYPHLQDDQDLELGSMQAMPFAQQHLVAAGANMTNFRVNTVGGDAFSVLVVLQPPAPHNKPFRDFSPFVVQAEPPSSAATLTTTIVSPAQMRAAA